ncbi:hypothetical protein L1987_60483 [Smallanthus sonchifolius]|uniref:Uncharacterized protein n=1 Tax=Smallanthus sonchifolius TaxID=185202 RepID=A0ACB9D8B0_9ASTR|nr:hypothetical protein L1987_60483 [Smallanthus sonchifolius]
MYTSMLLECIIFNRSLFFHVHQFEQLNPKFGELTKMVKGRGNSAADCQQESEMRPRAVMAATQSGDFSSPALNLGKRSRDRVDRSVLQINNSLLLQKKASSENGDSDGMRKTLPSTAYSSSAVIVRGLRLLIARLRLFDEDQITSKTKCREIVKFPLYYASHLNNLLLAYDGKKSLLLKSLSMMDSTWLEGNGKQKLKRSCKTKKKV